MAFHPPQSGIVDENRRRALFLVLKAGDPARDRAEIAHALAGIQSLRSEIAAVAPDSGLTAVVGVGARLWGALSPGRRPRHLRPLKPIGRGPRKAPATGGDVFLHVSCDREDLAFDLARRAVASFGRAAKRLEEVHGFTYRDSRDLTGFIDGTANPQGGERPGAALVGAEDPGFAGGSYVLTQRYVHDLDRWKAVPVSEQERVIGRRKADSAELPPGEKPENSHIARAEVQEGGRELKIVRHSYPYGDAAGEAGLFFVAYAADCGIFEKMLARLFGSAGDGLRDRLMEFTRPVSGAFFFAPSAETLAGLVAITGTRSARSRGRASAKGARRGR